MQFAFVLSVLVMGFMGSLHCAGMCGPVSCSLRNGKQFKSYHLGRLISYLILGSLLYYGSQFFVSTDSRFLKLAFSLIFSVLFVLFGLVQMNILKFTGQFKLYKYQFGLMSSLRSVIDKFPIVLGLLTGLFPCAWLYSFLLLSSQMQSYSMSVLVIFMLWATSLPAFYFFTTVLQKLVKNSKLSYQKISGFILITAGLLSVLGHWSDVIFLKL
jgi:uncharacterized protein